MNGERPPPLPRTGHMAVAVVDGRAHRVAGRWDNGCYASCRACAAARSRRGVATTLANAAAARVPPLRRGGQRAATARRLATRSAGVAAAADAASSIGAGLREATGGSRDRGGADAVGPRWVLWGAGVFMLVTCCAFVGGAPHDDAMARARPLRARCAAETWRWRRGGGVRAAGRGEGPRRWDK